jgi:hypothetical protein
MAFAVEKSGNAGKSGCHLTPISGGWYRASPRCGIDEKMAPPVDNPVDNSSQISPQAG